MQDIQELNKQVERLRKENQRLKDELNEAGELQGTPNLIVEQRSPTGQLLTLHVIVIVVHFKAFQRVSRLGSLFNALKALFLYFSFHFVESNLFKCMQQFAPNLRSYRIRISELNKKLNSQKLVINHFKAQLDAKSRGKRCRILSIYLCVMYLNYLVSFAIADFDDICHTSFLLY